MYYAWMGAPFIWELTMFCESKLSSLRPILSGLSPHPTASKSPSSGLSFQLSSPEGLSWTPCTHVYIYLTAFFMSLIIMWNNPIYLEFTAWLTQQNKYSRRARAMSIFFRLTPLSLEEFPINILMNLNEMNKHRTNLQRIPKAPSSFSHPLSTC